MVNRNPLFHSAGRGTSRRELMVLLGATIMVPQALRAQQKAMPVIGYLSGASGPGPDTDGLGQDLAEGSYVLGRNLNIEYRWAEGQFDRFPALAADLTSRGVVLIATATLPAAMAAKAATPTTPVVSSSARTQSKRAWSQVSIDLEATRPA